VLVCLAPALANPFLADQGGASAPTVRAPTSAAPLVGFQLGLRERAAAAVNSFASERSAGALLGFLGVALLYGVLHAAGPGHRKTVVFSLFLGRKAAPWEPLAAGFLSAGVHALSGSLVIGVLSLARGTVASLGDAERVGAWLDGGTFGLLILISLAFAAAKARTMLRSRGGHCGHPRALVSGERGLYGTVAIASLVPCPGVTMLLLFAIYAGQLALGIAGVLSMSLGMGLVVSAAGYLAFGGREKLFRSLKSRESAIALVSDLLEFVSYLLVAALSLYAAWPFFAALLSGTRGS
jgi:nickel/cobalt exporter